MRFKILSFALSAVFLLSLPAQAATVFGCCGDPACCASCNGCN